MLSKVDYPGLDECPPRVPTVVYYRYGVRVSFEDCLEVFPDALSSMQAIYVGEEPIAGVPDLRNLDPSRLPLALGPGSEDFLAHNPFSELDSIKSLLIQGCKGLASDVEHSQVT